MTIKSSKATGTASAALLSEDLRRIYQMRREFEKDLSPKGRAYLKTIDELVDPLYEAWLRAEENENG